MEASKKCLVIVTVVVLAGAALWVNGCKKSKTGVADSIAICMACGHIKDSNLCCKPNLPKCAVCGLAEGSPGCCSIPKDAETATICSECKEINGSNPCCKAS